MLTNKKITAEYWRDIIFQASGNTVAQIIGVAGIPILTRLYTPEAFAAQGLFIQLVIFLTAVVTLRYEYFVPLLKSSDEVSLLAIWLLRVGTVITLALTVVIYLALQLDLSEIFEPAIYNHFYLAPLTSLAVSISVFLQHEVQRQANFSASAKSEIYSKLCYLFFSAIFSVFTVQLGLLLSTMWGAVGKAYSLRSYISLSLKSKSKASNSGLIIARFKNRSLGMVLSNSLLTVSTALPLFYLGTQYGANIQGQFTLAISTVFLPSGLIGAAVGNVFYQRAAKLWANQATGELKELWRQTVIRLVVISLPVYIFIFISAEWAYVLIFGHQWESAGEFAKILTVCAFFSFIAGPLDRLSLVYGSAKYLPGIHLLRLISIGGVVIVANYFAYDAEYFVFYYSVAMAGVYLIDIVACRLILQLK